MTYADRIKEVYQKRSTSSISSHDLTRNFRIEAWHERQLCILSSLRETIKDTPFHKLSVYEVGIGKGYKLTELILLGFDPVNLSGCELDRDRYLTAKKILPNSCDIVEADYLFADNTTKKFDVVYQSTVFSSILDASTRIQVATKMVSMCKPGGSIIWYDFIYNNPANPDVHGLKAKEIKNLFPHCAINFTKVTLAPPIVRRICKAKFIFHILKLLPILKSHYFCHIVPMSADKS